MILGSSYYKIEYSPDYQDESGEIADIKISTEVIYYDQNGNVIQSEEMEQLP